MDICKYFMSFFQCDADEETHKHCILHQEVKHTFIMLFYLKVLLSLRQLIGNFI